VKLLNGEQLTARVITRSTTTSGRALHLGKRSSTSETDFHDWDTLSALTYVLILVRVLVLSTSTAFHSLLLFQRLFLWLEQYYILYKCLLPVHYLSFALIMILKCVRTAILFSFASHVTIKVQAVPFLSILHYCYSRARAPPVSVKVRILRSSSRRKRSKDKMIMII
jgi:hypothetical protein